MHPSITLLALVATPISALHLNLWPRAGSCPAVWSEVASELETTFAGCGKDAHGAIRAVFHDCITSGCDGSLILSDECTTRTENAGLSDICSELDNWRKKYSVGAADMIQFAAAMAISSCPLGPRVQALVGRIDSSVPSATGGVPGSRDSVEKILGAFSAKGFSPEDVVALMGTHSVALQFFDDPSQAGQSLDSTPSRLDIRFYNETKFGTAPYSLQSDRLLANATETRNTWDVYAESTTTWSEAFTSAWNRFAVVGSDPQNLQDCSDLIPQSSVRRRRLEANEAFVEKLRKKFIA
ncbi:ligninase LG6 precursor [Curvularia clavata]|uniref:Peroxidase n=1 Tax=Curvularia clavata TaxID=95742 RepID=A0A9Q9DUC3_CURCL|nr:ligninase LG6 precursor [Curvularia clavata]